MALAEQLIPMDLPTFVAHLGLAVMNAGAEIASQTPKPLTPPASPAPPPPAGGAAGSPISVLYQMPEAEIEVKVTLSRDTTTTAAATLGGTFQVLSLNASYSRTFQFKEEGSSSIRIKLVAVPAK